MTSHTTFDERQRRRELAAVRERQSAGERWLPAPTAAPRGPRLARPARVWVPAQRREWVVACPRNGEPTRCPIDRGTWPHRVEALVQQGDRILFCETHNLALDIVEDRRQAAA